MVDALPADYFDKHSLAELEKLTPKQAEDAGRLSYPVVLDKGASHFKPITWEAALKHIEVALKSTTPDCTGILFVRALVK